jgi:ankyrin repeat protein
MLRSKFLTLFSSEERARKRKLRQQQKISTELKNQAEIGNWQAVEKIVAQYGKEYDVINTPRRSASGIPSETAIMLASKNGHVKTVAALIKASCLNLHAVNFADHMNTALMMAVRAGKTEVVKLLIEVDGLDITMTNDKGESALSIARRHCREAVPYLFRNLHRRSPAAGNIRV